MNRFEEQLNTTAQTVHLSKDEKVLMREKMIQYMEMKPIRTVQIKKAGVISTWFNMHEFTKFTRARLAPALMVALLVASTSAGFSYAAEDALPGDTLYPVKVGVNEQVVSALMFSETARIAWLSQLAERRLEEASILTMQGRFDIEKGKEVALRFAEHTAALRAETQELEKSDPGAAAQASADAATTFEAHEAILARLAVEKDVPEQQATDLVGQVRVAAKALARLSEDAEQKAFKISTSSDVETNNVSSDASSSLQMGASLKEDMVIRMRTAARTNIDGAYALLARIANQQSDSALSTKDRIEAVEAAFTQSDELLARGEYSASYRSFKNVAANARTISKLLDAEVMFQIEILSSSSNSGTDSLGTHLQDTDNEARSLQSTQITKARTRAQEAISIAQKALLENDSSTKESLRAASALKDARAFVLRGDLAVVTNDNDDALYLFRQALQMAQRASELFDVQTQNDRSESAQPSDESPFSGLPDVSSLPPLDIVQVHHTYSSGVHTYSGVFVTPTTCFTLEVQATTTTSSAESIMLTLTTTETNTQCPQQVLDEKAFSVTTAGNERATLESVRLNGMPTKFVLIESTSTSPTQ